MSAATNEGPFRETWVERDDGAALCALINGDRGWLMYLRDTDDAGFSSRNPDYVGEPDATLDYVLDNGQRDQYPAAWALPLAIIEQALDYFRREGRRPPFVIWHDDAAG